MRRFWQGVALGAGGLAAGAAVLVLLLPGALDRVVPPSVPVTQGPVTQASSPVFAAEISGDAGLRLLAVFDPVQGDLRLARTEGGAVPGRVLELWVIADGAAPVSLGVLPEGASANVAVPEALRLAVASGLLAISDEPLGGSPTGAPTGAVLATGPVTAL
jgi:anti-sigma-K factor RskA